MSVRALGRGLVAVVALIGPPRLRHHGLGPRGCGSGRGHRGSAALAGRQVEHLFERSERRFASLAALQTDLAQGPRSDPSAARYSRRR